jgi:acyl-CoA thioesterase I
MTGIRIWRATILIVAFVAMASPFPSISARQNSNSQDTGVFRTAGRRNVGRVLDKLRAGKAVTVAYLGGSITSGSGASDPAKTSYRALLTDWMRTRYPKAKINEINASIPNTGSLYGAMRARRDVIAHKPDLVFVEFAVYDASEREDVAKRSLEGIVRQLLTVSQPPEIIFLYATTPSRGGRGDWQDVVASYYRLPAIDLQSKIWPQINAGQLSAASFWPGGVNTSDEGHRRYAAIIEDFLTDQEKQTAAEIFKLVPPPLLSDELTYGELIPVAQLKHDSNWRNEVQSDRALPSFLLLGDKPGIQFETIFEGTIVGIAYKMGPDAGIIECLIDGKPAQAPLDRIDAWDATSHIGTAIIAGGLGPGEHRLTVKVSADKNAKSIGSAIRLGYLIVGGQRPERL